MKVCAKSSSISPIVIVKAYRSVGEVLVNEVRGNHLQLLEPGGTRIALRSRMDFGAWLTIMWRRLSAERRLTCPVPPENLEISEQMWLILPS